MKLLNMKNIVTHTDPADSARNWTIQIILTVLAVYFYVFMEWLFFITKPSFMSRLNLPGTLQVFLVTPVPLLVTCTAILLLGWLSTR